MQEYYVHFSFYSEDSGRFDNISYDVMAETPFEARGKAWGMCDEDKDTLFRSNIKQFAVTWNPNLLDAGDYFYSHAASIKQSLGYLMNVELPNDSILKSGHQKQYERDRCSYLHSLYTLDTVAKDLYADKGMIPPSIYEELHYAEELCDHLGWGGRGDALWERMDKAKKWDRGAIYSIRDMFQNGYTTLSGEIVRFSEQLGRNSIYPYHNKPDEREYEYISRWQDKKAIEHLWRIPILKESDAIKNSAGHMDYTDQILLLDYKKLVTGYQTPENQFWQMSEFQVSDRGSLDDKISVKNPITGMCMSCSKNNFYGVLRPDVTARIDFDRLKQGYDAICSEDVVNTGEDIYASDIGEEGEFER